ncbi:MAG: baseplate J/gp47 family protein [Firmicutes bacterium]|nr:baseplate J/gp47 family protein [Bacillota bacterium]
MSSGTIAVACTESGTAGNVPANQITFMLVTIAGINAVYNMEPTSGGFEAEGDGELLERYYGRISVPATSGNKAQYKSWAK